MSRLPRVNTLFVKFKENPINGVNAMNSICSLAGSLIGVYVPIYLLKLGVSLGWVFGYWLLYYVCIFSFSWMTMYLASKTGLKRILIASLVLQLSYILMLHLLGGGYLPIWVVMVVGGAAGACYWEPLHIFFTIYSEAKKMGGSVGRFFAWPKIVGLPLPLVAGVIIVKLGFDYLFLLSAALYGLALIPIVLIPDFYSKTSFRLNIYLELFTKYIRYFGAEFLENVREEAEWIIVPVFVFLTFKSIISVGVINVLATLGGILFSLLVGKLTDKQDKRRLMRIGISVMVVAWVMRIFVTNQLIFYTLSLIVGFVEILVVVPFTSIIYASAKENNPVEFMLFREVSVTSARVFTYVAAIILVSNINYLFLVPIVALGLFLLY